MIARRLDIREALRPESLRLLTSLGRRQRLEAGETLFEYGDKGDALYLVESGSLGVYTPLPDGDSRLVSVIKPGETVGEMAVISGEPRSATVIAVRDARLLRLQASAFRRIARTDPALIAQLNRLLVLRLHQVSRNAGELQEPKNIAFLPAHPAVDLAAAIYPVIAELEAMGRRIAVVRREDGQVSQDGLNRMEDVHENVIFIGDHADQDWNAWCARQSDRIFITASGGAAPALDLETSILRQRARHQLLDLLIVHDGTEVAGNTRHWLALTPVNRHFHLVATGPSRRRLARIIAGAGVGLVLSGGGARAYAHIGVLRAIEEAGIPVDFLAGSSMGSIIAACYALDWPLDRIAACIRATFVASNPLSDYCFPLVSLVRGRKVERLLAGHYGSTDIEDAPRPFFCVSSNLSNGQVHVHRSGRLDRAIRASIALPGILPPVVTGDGVLVDGGVLDNMPVEAMRSTHRGPVIAVDAARDLTLTPAAFNANSGRGWLHRLMKPPIIGILMRSGTVSGERINRAQADAADLVIAPALGNVEIRDWKSFDHTVELGYREARRILAASNTAPFHRRPRG